MCGDDIVTHGQSQACAAFLCTEEWFKDVVPLVLWDSRAAILKDDFDAALKRPRADLQVTPSGHGIQRIQDQVKEYLLDLTAHHIDRWQRFRQVRLYFDMALTSPGAYFAEGMWMNTRSHPSRSLGTTSFFR